MISVLFTKSSSQPNKRKKHSHTVDYSYLSIVNKEVSKFTVRCHRKQLIMKILFLKLCSCN